MKFQMTVRLLGSTMMMTKTNNDVNDDYIHNDDGGVDFAGGKDSIMQG